MLQEKTILTFPEKTLEELTSLSSEGRKEYEQETVDYCYTLINEHFPQTLSSAALVTIVNGLVLNYKGGDKLEAALLLLRAASVMDKMTPHKPY